LGLFSEIDGFYELVAARLLPELRKLDAESAGIRHWLVIADADGVVITELDEDVESSAVLTSHAERGANAAYAAYTPGPPAEHVLAYVLMAGVVNSDLRKSDIIRDGGSVSLGPWQDIVS
jgi:hypothetical protein